MSDENRQLRIVQEKKSRHDLLLGRVGVGSSLGMCWQSLFIKREHWYQSGVGFSAKHPQNNNNKRVKTYLTRLQLPPQKLRSYKQVSSPQNSTHFNSYTDQTRHVKHRVQRLQEVDPTVRSSRQILRWSTPTDQWHQGTICLGWNGYGRR